MVYGSGEEVIGFGYVSEKGVLQKRKHPFERCCRISAAAIARRNRGAVREGAGWHMNRRDCPDYHGARLRREARFVRSGRVGRVAPSMR